jgi:hypothetical protein
MFRNIMNRRNAMLLQSLQQSKIDVCVDFDTNSGYGHYARVQNFIEYYGLEVKKWYSFSKLTQRLPMSSNPTKVLILDSFFANNTKLNALQRLYKRIYLIDVPLVHASIYLKISQVTGSPRSISFESTLAMILS